MFLFSFYYGYFPVQYTVGRRGFIRYLESAPLSELGIQFGRLKRKPGTLSTLCCRVYKAVVGKHPDLMVGQPTLTVFPTNDRNFEISQFFEKIFEKI